MPERKHRKDISVNVLRFDPAIDQKARFQEYKVPYEGQTVLSVLRYIYETIDSTLTFRWACAQGYCGGCVVLVNGKPVLPCEKVAVKVMTIEPNRGFKVLKDLIVDKNRKL